MNNVERDLYKNGYTTEYIPDSLWGMHTTKIYKNGKLVGSYAYGRLDLPDGRKIMLKEFTYDTIKDYIDDRQVKYGE